MRSLINFTGDSNRFGLGVVHGKAPKAPAPPDPVKTAQAQTQSNVNTAIANAYLQNANQVTPYGNLTNTQTGTQSVPEIDPKTGKVKYTYDIPTFTQTQTLSPADQALLEQQNKIEGTAYGIGQNLLDQSAQNLQTPMDFSSLPPLQQDFSADRRRVEDAFMGRFNEDYAQRQSAMDQKLANQGIGAGTNAANAAYQPLERSRNDMLTQAILAGGQEQSRLQGLNLGTRQQGIQEMATQRYEPINVASGLFGLGPGVQNPQFAQMAGSGIGGTDVMGAYNNAYQGQLANYQAQNASRNAMMGGVGSLLGTGLGIAFSDRRVKTDIEKVGKLDSGEKLYKYRYAWDEPNAAPRVGVMAQDVERTNPEAVGSLFGIKFVDYAKLVED
jgi:hypothetical protein